MKTLFVVLAFANFVYSASITPYIVGASDASEGQYPFMVSIQDSDDYMHICGGSILNKVWVLTAAHCVYELEPIDLLIRAATTNNSVDSGLQYFVDERIVHKDFSFETMNHNIALLRILDIYGVFDFNNPLLKPVILHKDNVGFPKEVTALGWGINNLEEYTWPQILQKLETQTLNPEICKYYEQTVRKTDMCINKANSDGLCNGDDGSPLVLKDTFEQVGVATYDRNCHKTDHYINLKYTRVSEYIDWIYENTNSWE